MGIKEKIINLDDFVMVVMNHFPIFEEGRYPSRQQNEDFEFFEPLQILLIDLLKEM